MKKVEVVATVIAIVFAIAGDGWYFLRILSGGVAPALATWLIFAVASSLSLASYLRHDGGHPFITNVANRTDPVLSWLVVVIILAVPGSDKSIRPFDIGCLVASGIILLFWLAAWKNKKAAFRANLSIQLIMSAGYLPTLHKLFAGGRNTESFLTWGLNLFVGILLIIAPVRRRDWLGAVYLGRAIVFMAIILAEMLYFDHRWLF